MKYVKGLDTVRAFAVFFVVLDHWGPYFPQHSIPEYLKTIVTRDGPFGVNLFFVLSGFLITSILLNEKVKNEGKGKGLTIIKNFFMRRVLRIFPVYYLVIFLCLLLGYTYVQDHAVYFLTYTSNILPYRTNESNVLSHTWSLSVEEQFYLVWPWLIIFSPRKYIKYLLILAIGIGVVSKYIAMYMLHHKYPVLVYHCFDSFGIGGLYAYMRLDEQKCRKFERGFVIALPLLLYIAWRMAPFGGIPVCVAYARLLDSIIALALIMFALNNKNEYIRRYLLENKALNFIGRISYGIYLYHFTFGPAYDNMVGTFIQQHPGIPSILTGFYFLYLLKLTVLTGICWLSFIVLEKPILALKKRFEYTHE